MEDMPIYEIILLEKKITVDKFGWPQYGYSESIGFYYELETARKAVMENWCNMNDCGKYNAAIVVQKIAGLFPITKTKGYFIYDKKSNTFKEVKLPKEWENFNIT